MSNSKPPNVEIKISGDGSHTLYNPELDETYHSHHGAITESKHVFIDAGLRSLISEKKEIRILEVGFGTGLNALLSLVFAEAHPDIDFHYHTLEPYPLSWDVAKNLNYVDQVNKFIPAYKIGSGDITWKDIIVKIYIFLYYIQSY